MKNGITVQQPPRCGSRCATQGTDISYSNCSSLNHSCRRYKTAARNPCAPQARPYSLILAAHATKCFRLLNKCPS